MNKISQIASRIRDGSLDFGRNHYSLSLLHGVLQAEHCGYSKITAIEFGVGEGGGFAALINSAEYFRRACNIEIEVYGFDTCSGLPEIQGYKDHPEVWKQGQFKTPNPQHLIEQLPEWAHLIIGNINDTISDFNSEFVKNDSRLGFVSVDVDLYSSTVPTLTLFELPPENYVPAVPIYFDDVNWLITYSQFAGEALAISEFNARNDLRKIESKENFNIENFHVCHVFDHPIRTGAIKPQIPFEIYAKPLGVVHPNGPYFSI
jgi:hypothetical protein